MNPGMPLCAYWYITTISIPSQIVVSVKCWTADSNRLSFEYKMTTGLASLYLITKKNGKNIIIVKNLFMLIFLEWYVTDKLSFNDNLISSKFANVSACSHHFPFEDFNPPLL